MVGGSAILGVVLVVALRPLVERRYGEEHNQVFSDGFAAVATMYAIIAGLLIFAVFNTYDSASSAAAGEAADLIVMSHNIQEFPQPDRSQAQDALRAYAQSVIDDDFPALAKGTGSPKTEAALDHMYDVIGPMQPDVAWSDQYTSTASHLDDVVVQRERRIGYADSALGSIYWFVLFGGGIITTAYLALEYTEHRTMHAVAVSLMAAMVGLVLFVLIEVNSPFFGQISVSPVNFEHARDVITRG